MPKPKRVRSLLIIGNGYRTVVVFTRLCEYDEPLRGNGGRWRWPVLCGNDVGGAGYGARWCGAVRCDAMRCGELGLWVSLCGSGCTGHVAVAVAMAMADE